jgi:predicted PurR-regulated permease PerM
MAAVFQRIPAKPRVLPPEALMLRLTEPAPINPPEVEEAMPLPTDPKVIYLGGLFFLGLAAALYIAAEIVWPLVIAFMLSLLFKPVQRVLTRLHVPRLVSALLIVLVVLGLVVGLGTAVSGPASTWAAKLPDGIPRLVERLRFLEGPLGALQDFWHQIEGFAGWREGASSSVGTTLLGHLFTGTRSFASGFFTTLLFLFFLLVAGEVFLQRLVEIMPRFSSKRQVVDISQQIETDISAYLVTITGMNAAVGVGTAAVMWFTGVGDPMLWGTIAFLLNFVPIIGPLIGVLIFILAGALVAENIWAAFIPAGLYLLIHLVEGEAVTPILLAKRFTLNPVLVIVSLVFWFWMWGAPGAILAVPMLAVTKIVCDRVRPLAALGHFLEG